MRSFKSIVALLLVGAFALGGKASADEDSNRPSEATVILVHGLFADGSSRERVIPICSHKGLRVISVQNPLTSLADDDVAATQRVIDSQTGPIVLVGHSWGCCKCTITGLIDRNCEHVVTYTHGPEPRSPQVALAMFVAVAFVGGSVRNL